MRFSCADQPDIFLQRLLKQTKDYLVQRGPDALQKFEKGYQEASAEATAALEGKESTSNRNLDLWLTAEGIANLDWSPNRVWQMALWEFTSLVSSAMMKAPFLQSLYRQAPPNCTSKELWCKLGCDDWLFLHTAFSCSVVSCPCQFQGTSHNSCMCRHCFLNRFQNRFVELRQYNGTWQIWMQI